MHLYLSLTKFHGSGVLRRRRPLRQEERWQSVTSQAGSLGAYTSVLQKSQILVVAVLCEVHRAELAVGSGGPRSVSTVIADQSNPLPLDLRILGKPVKAETVTSLGIICAPSGATSPANFGLHHGKL